jgi:hypothetical protein
VLNVSAILRGILSVLGNVRFLYRAALPWFPLLVFAGLTEVALPATYADAFIVRAVRFALEALCVAAIAVNTHRFVLLDELPDSPQISKRELWYILRGIRVSLPFLWLVAAMLFPILFITSAGIPFNADAVIWRSIIVIAQVLLLGLVVVPRSLSLPALAIDAPRFTVVGGREAAAGNEPRLLFLTIILIGPMLAYVPIADGSFFLLDPSPSWARLGVIFDAILLNPLVVTLETVGWAAMLSLSFAGLVEGNAKFLTGAASQQT